MLSVSSSILLWLLEKAGVSGFLLWLLEKILG